QRISVCLAHSVGALPSVRLGRTGNDGARRGFAPGAGAPTTEFARRSTALGAIGAYRQLRRRRRAFAPGAGAPTTEFARRSTALGAIGACRQLCAAGGHSHPGRVLLQRSLPVGAPPSVRWARSGNYGAAGGHSHPGRVLLQRSLPVGAPPSVRLGRAGNYGAAGGHSHPGRVLL